MPILHRQHEMASEPASESLLDRGDGEFTSVFISISKQILLLGMEYHSHQYVNDL